MTADDISHLTPVEVRWKHGQPVVEWCDFGDMAFTDPFFIHTYFRLCEADPEVQHVHTGPESLKQAMGADGLTPGGFIFHMSRCGSTLVSRLLGNCDSVLALGEPDPVLGMLEFPETIPERTRQSWLRDLLLALGRPRRNTERFFLIKFTSFHLFHLPLIRRIFPQVPWIFIYREPAAVMTSIKRKPTGFMRMKDDPEEADQYLRIGGEAIAQMSADDYLGTFLNRMFEFVLEQAGETDAGKALLVDYARLPQAVTEEIAPFLGLDLTHEDKERMQSIASLYSKDRSGTRIFTAGGDMTAQSPEARLAARWTARSHEKLCLLDRKLRHSAGLPA